MNWILNPMTLFYKPGKQVDHALSDVELVTCFCIFDSFCISESLSETSGCLLLAVLDSILTELLRKNPFSYSILLLLFHG